MDARIVHTQKVLKEAIIQLIQEKSIEKVTVVDLCKAADVNRATFYKYYESPMDLLYEIEDEFLVTLGKRIDDENPATPEDMVKLILQILDEHDKLYSLAFFTGGDYLFRKKFIDTVHDHSIGYIKSLFPKLSDFYIELVYYYIISGCMGACQVKRAGAFPDHTLEEVRTFTHLFSNFLCEAGRDAEF